MLVDINLIPKSSKKVNNLQIFGILMGILFVVGMVSLFILHNQAANERENLAKELEQIKTEIGLLEQNGNEYPTPNTNNDQTINNLLEEKIAMETALKPYVEQLPKDGSILSLDYNNTGTVTVELQLMNYDEIANYLKVLSHNEGIEFVKLVSVSTSGEGTGKKYIAQVDVNFAKKIIKEQAGE